MIANPGTLAKARHPIRMLGLPPTKFYDTDGKMTVAGRLWLNTSKRVLGDKPFPTERPVVIAALVNFNGEDKNDLRVYEKPLRELLSSVGVKAIADIEIDQYPHAGDDGPGELFLSVITGQ